MRTARLRLWPLFFLGLFIGLSGYLAYHFQVRPGEGTTAQYMVRGVDVSHYQGDIDWAVLAGQDIDFAFIKATEGRDYTDPKFQVNLENARKTGLRIGAYHYFTFLSSGDEQARHYISVVPKFEGMLPPVVDLELDASKRKNMLDKATVTRELAECLQALEAHYGMKPVVYAPISAYYAYVRGHFDDYGLWVRSVRIHPALLGAGHWTFWQYSDQGLLQGYAGPEKNIDLNVFAGDEASFSDYPPAGG